MITHDPWPNIRRRGPSGPNPWTAQKIDDLKRFWAAGYSASECQRKLGPQFTRNAVIGKVHRLKLARRPNPIIRNQNASIRPPAPVEELTEEKIDSAVDALLSVKGARRGR